jgi:ABC-type polysaccharide/polyol phosphate export permease
MDYVQKYNICINVPSSQTFRSYVDITLSNTVLACLIFVSGSYLSWEIILVLVTAQHAVSYCLQLNVRVVHKDSL